MTKTITTRIDSNDKKMFYSICESAGLTASEAINMFIKETIREQEIPFKIKVDPFYSKENMELLRRSAKEMDEAYGKVHKANLDN